MLPPSDWALMERALDGDPYGINENLPDLVENTHHVSV